MYFIECDTMSKDNELLLIEACSQAEAMLIAKRDYGAIKIYSVVEE